MRLGLRMVISWLGIARRLRRTRGAVEGNPFGAINEAIEKEKVRSVVGGSKWERQTQQYAVEGLEAARAWRRSSTSARSEGARPTKATFSVTGTS